LITRSRKIITVDKLRSPMDGIVCVAGDIEVPSFPEKTALHPFTCVQLLASQARRGARSGSQKLLTVAVGWIYCHRYRTGGSVRPPVEQLCTPCRGCLTPVSQSHSPYEVIRKGRVGSVTTVTRVLNKQSRNRRVTIDLTSAKETRQAFPGFSPRPRRKCAHHEDSHCWPCLRSRFRIRARRYLELGLAHVSHPSSLGDCSPRKQSSRRQFSRVAPE
jgi:hypothetical protein